MTTLRVLLHVAAQRDYELHSLDFSTAFLQGSLHEEIWLRRPPGFTGSFPLGTQWSLRRPVYGLRQAPREWHDTLRTTLAALGFAPSTADPLLFLRTDTSLPPFYILVLGSGSVSWRSTRSSSVLGSSCEAEIYAGAVAAQELRWLTYLLADLGELPRSPPVLYVDNKAMLALCREHRLEHRLEHRMKHIALRYFLARELQQRGQLRLAYVAYEANTADIFTKALPLGDHQCFCTMLDCVVFLLAECSGDDEPDPGLSPRWGDVEDCPYDESATGAEDDVEWLAADGLPEDLPVPSFPPPNKKRPHPSKQNRDARPPSHRSKPSKYKRNSYTSQEKLQWIAKLESEAVSVRRMSRDTGISRKSLAEWKSRKGDLEGVHGARKHLHRHGRASWYRDMEIEVYSRVFAHRKRCLSVSVGRLQKWSHEVMKILHPDVKWAGSQRGELNPYVYDVSALDCFHAVLIAVVFPWVAGNIRKPPPELTLKWISKAWKAVPKELIQRSFLTCSISNALDGSQNNLCMQHRRDAVKGEVELDDEIAADGFCCNNVEEPESDGEADQDGSATVDGDA
ncbi:unnamed protein product [Closterium sp. NIES-54]